MHGPISAVLRQPAPRPPHRQHDGDAGVTHGRTPVERSAHRAPSEARPSHVVRAEQVGQGGPASTRGCGSGILGGLLGGARRRQAACGGWQRQRGGGAGSRGAIPGLSVGGGCVATVWARSLTGSGLLTLRGVVLALVRRLGVSGALGRPLCGAGASRAHARNGGFRRRPDPHACYASGPHVCGH